MRHERNDAGREMAGENAGDRPPEGFDPIAVRFPSPRVVGRLHVAPRGREPLEGLVLAGQTERGADVRHLGKAAGQLEREVVQTAPAEVEEQHAARRAAAGIVSAGTSEYGILQRHSVPHPVRARVRIIEIRVNEYFIRYSRLIVPGMTKLHPI
jgi:hypothetical protein